MISASPLLECRSAGKLRLLVTDGIRDAHVLADGDLDEFRKFLREFAQVKILPDPTARRLATELIAYDSATRVKVYPYRSDSGYDYTVKLDANKGRITLLDGKTVLEELKLRESLYEGFPDKFTEWDDTADDGCPCLVMRCIDLIPDLFRPQRATLKKLEKQAEQLEMALKELEYQKRMKEAEVVARDEVRKLVAIEDERSGEGVVLEVVSTLLTLEELAEEVEGLLSSKPADDPYAFAREVLKELYYERRAVYPSDLSPADALLGEAGAPCVYVYLGKGIVTTI